MASTDALWNLGVAFGYAVAGPLVAWLGPRTLYVAAGLGALVGTAILAPLWRAPAGEAADAIEVGGDAVPVFTSAEELERAAVES
jgi:hypothetical protein